MTSRTYAFRLAVSLTAFAAVLTGCSSVPGTTATSGSATTKLTVLHKWPEPQREAFWTAIKTGFEATHPGVTVEMTAAQDDPYKEKLKVLTASRELPDVYFAWPGKYGEQYFQSGMAADLTEAMSKDGWAKSLTPAAVNAYTVDGHIYGVPISMSGKFFIYNTKIFADRGIKVPKTLDDLYQACVTLKAAGVSPITFGNQPGWPGVHYLTTLIAKYVPADVMAKDFNPKTAEFTDPGYEKALATLGDLSDKCLTPNANGITNDSAKAEVQTGVAAMGYFETNNFSIFTAAGGATEEVAANWSFFPFPSITGSKGDDASLTGAPDGFLVNPDSANKDLAIEFLRYLTSQESGRALLEKFGRPSTVIGADKGVTLSPQLTAGIAAINKVDRFNIWLDTATVSEVAQAFLAGGQAAVDHSQTPAQIMASVRAASESSK